MAEQNKSTKYLLITLAILVIVIILLSLETCHLKKKSDFSDLQQSVFHDSLKVTKNKLGQETAQIGLILTDYASFKALTFNNEDSLGKELQKLIGKNKISATIATQQIRIDTVSKTDSIYYANGDSCNPIYVLADTTQFRWMNIHASRDSFDVKLRLFEKLTFVQEWDRWRLFRKQSCLTKYTNSNPDVDITGLRTFTVKCDCSKKSWIAFGGGNITGFLAGFGSGYVYGKLKK